MMLEPTKAEIARRKKVAARSALADAVSRSSSEKKVEPTRADFGLPSDFDFEEFDAFLKKRERLSLAVKLIIFAIVAAAFVFALHDDSEDPNFMMSYLGPLAYSYVLIFVLPFADYILKSIYGDEAYINDACDFRVAFQNWKHFQTVSGEGYWRALRGRDLEWAAAGVFRERGWKVSTTATTGDGGVDLVLKYANTTFFCQCKGHVKPVSVGAVREIAGVCAASSAIPMLIVVNGVTGPAFKTAKELSVVVWDRAQLAAFARGDLALS